jgi:Fibronectin type III domain/Protein of unknown function (DUF2510)
MSTPTMTPSGWYPDPSRRHQYRYWDGGGWSSQVSDSGRMTSDPELRPPSSPAGVPAAHPLATPAPAAARPSWPETAQPQSTRARPSPQSSATTSPLVLSGVQGPGREQTAGGKPPPAAAAEPSERPGWLVPVAAVIAALALIAGLVIWAPWASKGPPAPTAVHASSPTATSVLVQWTPTTGDPPADHFLILRNGVQVGSVVRTMASSYQDAGLAPATTYRYSIVAVSATTKGDPSADVTVKTLAVGPVGLSAGAVTTNSVTFRWSRPATAPDSYVMLRDGTSIGTADGNVTSYQDNGLVPSTAYRYTMMGVSGGVRSAPSSVLTVKTLTPPVSAARLTGSWSVGTKIVSSGGGTPKVGSTETDSWQFAPKCTVGPCAVVVSGEFGNHPFTVTLARSGAVYTGSNKAHITHCGDSPNMKDVMNTVTLRITVTKGAMGTSQAWTANSLAGTMTIDSPYTPAGAVYCPAQSVTSSLTGSP